MLKRLLILIIPALACTLSPTSDSTSPTATIPIATNPPAATNPIHIAMIIPEDNGQNGKPVGCGDSVVMVDTDRTTTGDMTADLRAALEVLFAIHTPTYGEFDHSLGDVNVAVQNVIVEGDQATVNLTGTFMLVGTCSDARMQAQISETLFQFPALNTVLMYVDGQNVRQMFDMSGSTGNTEPFRR